MGYSRAQLEEFRDGRVDDLIGRDVRLLFVGINPGLLTAATNTHFCHPTNRFYPALRLAGLIDWQLDPAVGMSDDQRENLIRRGIGITNLVNRATARADELGVDELREGARRLTKLVGRFAPSVVAVAGITAYRSAFARPRARLGLQEDDIGGAAMWVIPNPSGLNAHLKTADMACWVKQLSDAASLR